MGTKSIRLEADGNCTVQGADLTSNASLKMNDQTFVSSREAPRNVQRLRRSTLVPKETDPTPRLLAGVWIYLPTCKRLREQRSKLNSTT